MGNNSGIYARSISDLAALCTKYGISYQYYFLFNESLITRARNYCCDEFMRSDNTHMMFIDSDIGFNPNDVIAMLAMMDDDSEYDVLAGPYPKKTIAWEKVKLAVDKGVADEDPTVLDRYIGDYVFNPADGTGKIQLNEPAEVMEAGTGFMMIRKKTFERFQEAYPQQWYRPDHVRTEHFDGSREIMAYFDTPIDHKRTNINHELKVFLEENPDATHDQVLEFVKDPDAASRSYSKRYLSEDYMFCVPGNTKVVTKDGVKSIEEIVETRYCGQVKSLNSAGNVEWQNVTNWMRRKNDESLNKKWVKVNTTSDNRRISKLKCTADHKVACFENPLKPNIEFVEAKDLTGLYTVRDPHGNLNINSLYDEIGISFMVGTLLGDATISKAGQFMVGHTKRHSEYTELKAKLFGGIPKLTENNRGYSGSDLMCGFAAPVNAQTKYLREIMYVDGKKTPKNIIDFIDERALAFWCMDDGSMKDGSFGISSCGFTVEENELLVAHLQNKFGIISKVYCKTNGKKTYPSIVFTVSEAKKLFKIISPYVIECMEYKIPKEYQTTEKYSYPSSVRLDFGGTLVREVVDEKPLGDLFDITVENTHNFIAGSTYVHNCRWARDIGLKVWLCPWMKLQHAGSMIFGGSLADLASISANATADRNQLKKRPKKRRGK